MRKLLITTAAAVIASGAIVATFANYRFEIKPRHDATAWDCTITKSGIHIGYIVDGNRLEESDGSTPDQIVLNNEYGLIAASGDMNDTVSVAFMVVIDKKTGDFIRPMIIGRAAFDPHGSLSEGPGSDHADGKCIEDPSPKWKLK